MQVKYKALAIVGAIAVLTSAVSAWSSYSTNTGVIESAKQRELKGTATLIQNDLAEQGGKAAARASLIVGLPSVQAAFRKGGDDGRADLMERLGADMAIQRDKFGVREGQFHTAPAISYLRVYDPTAGHGEDLSGFREMILAANRKQAPQRGVEIGRRGLSIRGVDVVKDKDGPIGTFEIGLDFTTVLEDLKKNAGFDSGAFVDKTMMADIATLLPKPDNERIVGAYQNVEATNWKLLRPMVSADLLAEAKDVVGRIKTVDGVDYGMVAVPLLDFKGARIGAIVAMKSFEDYQAMQGAAMVRAIGFGLLQAMILAGAMLTLINVLFVHPAEAAEAERKAKAAKDAEAAKDKSNA